MFPFTRLSESTAMDSKLQLETRFVSEYMPYAPESYVKVYLYGFALACGMPPKKPGESGLAEALGLEETIVSCAFAYWEENGLVSIHSGEEPYVEYLPVQPYLKQIKKYPKDKFKGFNDQLHALLPARNFLPNEYNEYYYAMDSLHIEVEAMLTIIGYCKRLKGDDIGSSYILTVARNLAADGCTTYDKVSERLNQYDFYNKDLSAVLKALSLKRKPDHEDTRLLIKWTKTLGFKLETVVQAAKKLKRGSMEKLDAQLTKYFELHLFSIADIENYLAERDSLYELTREINRRIGVYYEQVDFIIENYIMKWLSMGYTNPTLLSLSAYCFTTNVRTLEGMNTLINRFYKQGLISSASIEAFISAAAAEDDRLAEILSGAGISVQLSAQERNFLKVWKNNWNMSDDLLRHAALKSAGKAHPIGYMNTILSCWFDKGVKTKEEADSVKTESDGQVQKKRSAEELNAMFDALNEGGF